MEQGYELFVPTGEYSRELIYFQDLNEDGINEALVFLRDKNKNTYILEAVYQDKNWKEESLLNLSATSILSFRTADLDRDHFAELYIVVEDQSIFENMLFVFEKAEDQIIPRFSKTMRDAVIGEIGEQNAHLYTVMEERDEQDISHSRVDVYEYRGKQYNRVGEVPIEPYFYGPYNTQIGYVNSGKKALIVDLGIGAHSGKTEVIMYENEKWKNLFTETEEKEQTLLFQAYPRISKDVDGDGIIEFPVPMPTMGDEDKSMAETIWVDTWYQLDDSLKLQYDCTTVSNDSVGYTFLFPTSWENKVRVEMNAWNEIEPYMDFYIYEGGETIPLYWIYFIDKTKYGLDYFTEMERVGETETYYILRQSFDIPNEYHDMQIPIEEFQERFQR